MKRKHFSVEQIVAVLKQAELDMLVADILRQVGISERTFYCWKKQYADLQSDQVRELKQLQDENARLKKLVAELILDKVILQDGASKKGAARAEARRGEVHGQPLQHEAAPGLCIDQADTQHAVLPKRDRSEDSAAAAHARHRAGSGANNCC
jgi:putative transposase